MDGILVQTTRNLRALLDVASECGSPDAVGLAFRALADQWSAAEREAARTPGDAVASFDARAAAVIGAAYRPVVEVLSVGGSIAGDDLVLAQRSSGWLNLAYESLLAGDTARVERCLEMAAGCVGLAPRSTGESR